MTEAPNLLTVPEVASYLGFDRDGHDRPELAVRRLLEVPGGLRGFKLGRRWRVRLTDLEQFVDDQLAAQDQGGVG